MGNNKKIICYKITMENVSPLSIGNGGKEYSDHDVMVDNEGKFVIPATSIAGVLRSGLDKKDQEKLFGFIIGNDYKNSPLVISDASAVSDPKNDKGKKSVRDGIELDDNKQTVNTAKYDYEIIENGATITFNAEIKADENEITEFEALFEKLIYGIDKKYLRFGYKSNRGSGALKIKEVNKCIFTNKNYKDYLHLNFDNMENYSGWKVEDDPFRDKFDSVNVELSLVGGISIRTYSKGDGLPDFEHINNAGSPIIPGTSWNGLFRSYCRRYFKDHNISNYDIIDSLFGREGDKSKGISPSASKIVFLESIFQSKQDGASGEDITITRTQIDRFAGNAINGSLFTERVHYGGETTLEILIKKDLKNKQEYSLIEKAILCALKDINNGFETIGGLASIGRGRLVVKSVEINGKSWDVKKGKVVPFEEV